MITDTYGTSSIKKSEYMSGITFSETILCTMLLTFQDTTSEKANEIRELLQIDRKFTIRDIGLKVGLSTSTVHSIITRELSMSKASARWIPRILTIEQKHLSVEPAKSFLKQYRNHGLSGN